jgi:hypothetical protein
MSAKSSAVQGLAAAAAGLLIAACGSASALIEESPATIKPVPGSSVQQVQLSAAATHRLGIETQAVRVTAGANSGRSGTHKVIPYSAVVYDTDGSTWTYVESAARTFVRNRITVADIEGHTAVLTKGPAVGAHVVTVGAPELLGAEYDISGEE